MTVREAGDDKDSEETLANNIKLAGGDLADNKITEDKKEVKKEEIELTDSPKTKVIKEKKDAKKKKPTSLLSKIKKFASKKTK